jgi:ubiquinol-cytochrome c reductase iron-sulfur subunit
MKKERRVAAALVVSIAGSIVFAAAYATGAGTTSLGFGLALAALGLCAAFAAWEYWLLPHDKHVEMRHDLADDPAAVEKLDATIEEEGSALSRPLLVRLLLGAFGALGLAALFPFRSLGTAPDGSLFKTKWKRGVRVVRDDGRLLRQGDLNVDAVVTAFPEGAIGDAASQVMLIRLPERYVAFSKVCTHAGCPVALYRAAQRQLLCPCHQSLFDVLDAGKVLQGPAARPLPQLPIAFGDDGYLYALGDFPEPIGPGFWQNSV